MTRATGVILFIAAFWVFLRAATKPTAPSGPTPNATFSLSDTLP